MSDLIRKPLCPYADYAENLEGLNEILEVKQRVYDITNKKFKIGDGVHHWNDLPWEVSNSYERDNFTVLIKTSTATDGDMLKTISSPKQGDIAVVKSIISTGRYQYTGYVYNGLSWGAMDGNYNASNVYFDSDIIITTAIGNITLTNGQGTIPSQGKNLKETIESVLSKEKTPTITSPSVTVKIAQNTSSTVGSSQINVEAGSSITPKWNASFNPGKYEYGPDTGVSVTKWEISDTKNNTSTSSSGNFSTFKVTDTQSYRITAKATHTSGTIPKTNLGANYSSGQISSGIKTGYSPYIKGYRTGYFIGTTRSVVNSDNITSDIVRGLSKKKVGNYSAETVTLSVNSGTASIIIACPADKTGMTKVLNTTVNADMTSSFSKITNKTIAGADGSVSSGYQADYNIWIYTPAEPYSTSASLNITLG